MPTPTVAVTVTLEAQDGTPYGGVTVRARLDQNDVYQGIVISDQVEAVTNALGVAVLNCFPNALAPSGLGTVGTIYSFRANISGGRNLNAQAVVPNQACRLENILVNTSPAEQQVLAAAASATAAAASASSAAASAASAASAAATYLDTYAALRAYAGVETRISITGYLVTAAPAGIAGLFVRDDTDTTTSDNDGTVIVDSSGRRWKRKYNGALDIAWFGAVGDGATSDHNAITAGIAASAATGRPLEFNGALTYAYDGIILEVLAGAKLRTNGCLFRSTLTTTSNTVAFRINANCVVDQVLLDIPTGVRRDRGVQVLGNDVQVGRIRLASADVQLCAESLDAGVVVTAGSRQRIGVIDVTNFDRSINITNTTNCKIETMLVTGYVRGVYGFDNVGLECDFLLAKTASINASNLPGHNALLLSCNSDSAQRDVLFRNVIAENAGEHAIRIGGDFPHKNVRIENWTARKCGNCGVKILGTDATAPTQRNKNIYLGVGVVEDCGTSSSSATNRAAILAQFVDDLHIGPLTVRTKDNARAAAYGILLDACANVVVAPYFINDVELVAIYIFANNGDVEVIQLNGGIARGCGNDGVRMETIAGKAMRQVHVNGMLAHTNAGNGFSVINAGTMEDCLLIGIQVYNNTAGAGACNSAAVTIDVYGAVGATPLSGVTAANGSRWSDGTTLNIRKAGAWTAL